MPDRFDYDPRNPVYDLSYDPKGGKGKLVAHIWWESELLGCAAYVLRELAYEWVETV